MSTSTTSPISPTTPNSGSSRDTHQALDALSIGKEEYRRPFENYHDAASTDWSGHGLRVLSAASRRNFDVESDSHPYRPW